MAFINHCEYRVNFSDEFAALRVFKTFNCRTLLYNSMKESPVGFFSFSMVYTFKQFIYNDWKQKMYNERKKMII